MNENYQEYINRVGQLTLTSTHALQLKTIQKSPKFVQGKAISFPGYSVITPPNDEDNLNSNFYSKVEILQQELSQFIDAGLIIPLPSPSFHFTIADLIWDISYQQAVAENANFSEQLREEIKYSFSQYQNIQGQFSSIEWQLYGIALRPRAIILCLAPKDQESYQAIIELRSCIYQNAGLMALGIEQQYDFTGHITLGYFGDIPENLDRDLLSQTIAKINDLLLEDSLPVLKINRIELRQFDDMLTYSRQPDWAVVEF
ncbi:MAG: DUF1868 domain-containing protein [Xenococcaceae cyanobacterium MO_167.B27]|nr:DUF1868 domain-containing protein [Xenococcaceae cyanobacterium MO_167.B27]